MASHFNTIEFYGAFNMTDPDTNRVKYCNLNRYLLEQHYSAEKGEHIIHIQYFFKSVLKFCLQNWKRRHKFHGMTKNVVSVCGSCSAKTVSWDYNSMAASLLKPLRIGVYSNSLTRAKMFSYTHFYCLTLPSLAALPSVVIQWNTHFWKQKTFCWLLSKLRSLH